jgi:beta-hydroxylase
MASAAPQSSPRIDARCQPGNNHHAATGLLSLAPKVNRDAAPFAQAPYKTATAVPPAQDCPGGVAACRPARGLFSRIMKQVVHTSERLNLAYAKIAGNPMVYDEGTFPWEMALEKAAPVILAELTALLERQAELPSFRQIVKDVDVAVHDELWKTFILCGYGVKSKRNIQACPRTWEAVKAIPGLKTVMFSIMEPGTHLAPHRGPYNGVLRAHLGLIIPEPSEQVAIRVGRTICHWRTGKVIIFDDAYEHEAWNLTDATRVVLFLDFVKPLRFPASVANWALLNLAVFSSFVREGAANQSLWEQQFYRH